MATWHATVQGWAGPTFKKVVLFGADGTVWGECGCEGAPKCDVSIEIYLCGVR